MHVVAGVDYPSFVGAYGSALPLVEPSARLPSASPALKGFVVGDRRLREGLRFVIVALPGLFSYLFCIRLCVWKKLVICE